MRLRSFRGRWASLPSSVAMESRSGGGGAGLHRTRVRGPEGDAQVGDLVTTRADVAAAGGGRLVLGVQVVEPLHALHQAGEGRRAELHAGRFAQAAQFLAGSRPGEQQVDHQELEGREFGQGHGEMTNDE